MAFTPSTLCSGHKSLLYNILDKLDHLYISILLVSLPCLRWSLRREPNGSSRPSQGKGQAAGNEAHVSNKSGRESGGNESNETNVGKRPDQGRNPDYGKHAREDSARLIGSKERLAEHGASLNADSSPEHRARQIAIQQYVIRQWVAIVAAPREAFRASRNYAPSPRPMTREDPQTDQAPLPDKPPPDHPPSRS